MYKVSQLWPNRLEKKPLPLVCWKWKSWPKSTTDGLKIQAMARKVSGIIERIASVVANIVPKRMPADRRDGEDDQADDRDAQRPVADRRAEHRERSAGELEPVRDVQRGQDHVQRRHREPAEPIRPRGEPIDVLGEPGPFVLVGRVGVGWQSARPVGHHRRQLRQEEAHEIAGDGDEHDHGYRCGSQLGDHDRRDPGDQDRAREADHEGAPPVGRLREPRALVDELVLKWSGRRLFRPACALQVRWSLLGLP